MVSTTPEAEDFRVTYFDEIPSVHIPVRLSVLEAVNFKKTCQQLFSESTVPSTIVLDFTHTTFIDSSGIGALVSNLKFAKQRGSDLVLRSLKPQVMAVFALTSLDQVLTIEQTPATSTRAQTKSPDNQLPMTHPSVQSLVKRLIDIVGAIVGLVITGILLVPIAAAITINDPGPILFAQTRCGWMGRKFKIWKFRSMCTNAEAMKDQIKNQASGALPKSGASYAKPVSTNCRSFGTCSKAK
jgi:anti-anti-sigma factor